MTTSLPARPSLENLKKQAKTLLKSHHSGDLGVCATLRRLHRFAHLSDQQILSSELSLAEVQYALAMEYGFPSWSALKKAVKAKEDEALDAQGRANRMVERIMAQRPELSPMVAKAMMTVPRHVFLGDTPVADANDAYEDRPLEIQGSAGQVAAISQPSLVAMMLEALRVRQGQRVLEIGAASGYVAALLSELTGPEGYVASLEIDPVLVGKARENLHHVDKDSVRVLEADAFVCPSELADERFDRVLFSASVQMPPEWIVHSLSDGGVILFPLDLLVTRPGWPCLSARLQKEADYLQGELMGPIQGWQPLRQADASPRADPDRVVQWGANETWYMLESYYKGGLTNRSGLEGLVAYLLGRIESVFQSGRIQTLEDCRSWLDSPGWEDTHRQWLEKGAPGLESFALRVTRRSAPEPYPDKEVVWMRESGEVTMCLLV